MLRLFIGANNETGEVEKGAINSVLESHFGGWTMYDSMGYWNGGYEKSVVVEIQPKSADMESQWEVERLIGILKARLKQDSIGYQILPPINFI